MENTHKVPTPNGRAFNGKPHMKLKRVRTEPRQRIRQLLRSFVPLSHFNESKDLAANK